MLELRRLPLHPKQAQILKEARRYNVLKCGRKFGKTTLCEELIRYILLRQKPIAYYSPSYKELSKVWDRMKKIFEPIIIRKDETLKILKCIGGGQLDMWSLDNPDAGRGFEYARVIIDEAEYIPRLKEAWEENITATLLKLQGDAWFLSTPQFGSTYFKKLSKIEDPDWMSWVFTTYDNPHIPAEEIDKIRNRLDEAVFECEYMAKDISLNVNKFIYNFSTTKHISKGLQIIPYLPVILSFDFNVEPITCLVGQTEGLHTVRILDEYRLLNSDIYELCNRILSDYPDKMLVVTGDASGQNRTAFKRDMDYYKIIKQELKLGMGQFKIPKANPPIKNTRVLCNSLLGKHPNYLFSDRVPYLVTDIESCEVDSEGGIDKTKDKHQSHLLDCWRYFNYTFLHKFLDMKVYQYDQDTSVPG